MPHPNMLRIRPYNIKDAETILSWTKDEKAFYKWTAGVLGTDTAKKLRKNR